VLGDPCVGVDRGQQGKESRSAEQRGAGQPRRPKRQTAITPTTSRPSQPSKTSTSRRSLVKP
jgi:hypothetical protein